MLDIKFIKENKDLVKEAVRKKHVTVDIDRLVAVDDQRLGLLAEVESLRAKQNMTNDLVTQATTDDGRAKIIGEMRVVKETLGQKEDELKEVMKEWQTIMITVPNVPDTSVPEGEDETGNQEVRKWGERRKFDFTPKNHVELMQNLHLADFDRGSKVAGFRGYFLKNEAVMMSYGLWSLALELLTKKGFTPMIVPSQVKRENLLGTGYLPHGEEDLYHNQDNDYYAGTGEVATMGLYAGEILDVSRLPIKFASFSPCFRREAGSHGKDTKGLIRVHEFFKVEQLIFCEANHEQSVELHELLTANAEELLQSLNLPYRVIVLCTGDMGLPHVKTYDIETWVPTENKYRETHSSSYYHDFQTRRMNIRYKDKEGKVRFAHSLNNTAVATPRILAAIVENYQNEDGSVTIPEVLRPYMGGREVIR